MSLYIRNEQLIRTNGFTAKLISGSTTTDDTITSPIALATIATERASATNGSQSIVAEHVAIVAWTTADVQQPKPNKLSLQNTTLQTL